MTYNQTGREDIPSPHPQYPSRPTPDRPEVREHIHAALALLLGPETSYTARERATRRLIRLGSTALSSILNTLNSYPEITTPAWPWWPPQYTHCSHLLFALQQKLALSLPDLLHHPHLTQSPGPVLWISVIEATERLPQEDYEDLLCQGLEATWETVRYAAAMALVQRSKHEHLHPTTLHNLSRHLDTYEAYPVRLTAAYALFSNGHKEGFQVLIQLTQFPAPAEVRKAAIFILAGALVAHSSPPEREEACQHFLMALQDPDPEVAYQAALALGRLGQPSLLYTLQDIFFHQPHLQLLILVILETGATRSDIRRTMRDLHLPASITTTLHSESAELRRQACCTLAAYGGEYALAVLGTILQDSEHPAYREGLESIRLMRGSLQASTRQRLVQWLLQVLHSPQEILIITALDSLAYLLWKARNRGQKKAWLEISQAIQQDAIFPTLLHNQSSWVRQRSVEILSLLARQSGITTTMSRQLIFLLREDEDAGVRACVAFVCGLIELHEAIPDLIVTLLDRDEYVAETALNTLFQFRRYNEPLLLLLFQELAGYGTGTGHLAQTAQQHLKGWSRRRYK